MTCGRDEPCIQPVYDTWRGWSGAASWLWSLRTRPPGDEAPALNPWGAGQLAGLLAALAAWARVCEVSLNTPPGAPLLAVSQPRWTADEPHVAFERRIVDVVRSAPQPISGIELVFDLCAAVRTVATPTATTRGWVSRALWGSLQLEVDSPYGSLALHHTLFFGGALHGDSNAELYELNQPALRDALAAIEAALGPIEEQSGLPGVTRTGIAPATASP